MIVSGNLGTLYTNRTNSAFVAHIVLVSALGHGDTIWVCLVSARLVKRGHGLSQLPRQNDLFKQFPSKCQIDVPCFLPYTNHLFY